MTPTFSGCPALDVMRREIQARVLQLGIEQVEVKTVLHPPWSSNWITSEGREKLRGFGLAPPPRLRERENGAMVAFFDAAVCPHCGSTHTTLKNTFGPTLCRMIWYCHDCQDAFEQFKPL
jgi:ring-1,2-phenylacetyl-CoA epoxidase subunit PaaD